MIKEPRGLDRLVDWPEIPQDFTENVLLLIGMYWGAASLNNYYNGKPSQVRLFGKQTDSLLFNDVLSPLINTVHNLSLPVQENVTDEKITLDNAEFLMYNNIENRSNYKCLKKRLSLLTFILV